MQPGTHEISRDPEREAGRGRLGLSLPMLNPLPLLLCWPCAIIHHSMITERSKLSLCQFLALQEQAFVEVLLRKNGLQLPTFFWDGEPSLLDFLDVVLSKA